MFLKQLAWLAKNPPSRELPPIRLIYVAIIDRALYYEDYRPLDLDNALPSLEKDGFDLPPLPDTISYLGGAPGRVIVVDNTSSQAIAESYPVFLAKGISIVTPNKKGFSGSYRLFRNIFDTAAATGAFVYHESSVGAGMPIISTLNDLVMTGDEVTRIEGVFSGTLSFLFNNFSPAEASGPGSSWSAEVRKAKELGYTEPDPRDDLNGMDVARKVTILARLAGLPIESPASFKIESLIPPELASAASSEEFMNGLAQYDDRMEEVRSKAQKEGKVVRYVGSVDFATKEVKVGLEYFESTSGIATLRGADNMISFYTKRYGALPLAIRGAGAGGDVTAMGVTADVLKILTQI